MTEISSKETRAAATGGATQCSDASPEESSSSTAAGKVVDHKAQVMRSIHRALGLLHQLYLTVSSFYAASLLIHRLLIDDERNPDELTCNVLNQVAKGKTDAFKSLWMHLLEELEQVFLLRLNLTGRYGQHLQQLKLMGFDIRDDEANS